MPISPPMSGANLYASGTLTVHAEAAKLSRRVDRVASTLPSNSSASDRRFTGGEQHEPPAPPSLLQVKIGELLQAQAEEALEHIEQNALENAQPYEEDTEAQDDDLEAVPVSYYVADKAAIATDGDVDHRPKLDAKA